MAPSLRTEGEWRYASFSSSSCLFFSGDCASGELSRPPPALAGVGSWALAWRTGANSRRGQNRPGRSLLSLRLHRAGEVHCATSVVTNAGRKHCIEDARAQLVAHRFDLEPGLLGALLDLLAGAANALLRVLTHLGEGGLALRIPLLQLLVAGLEDLGLGRAELVFVGCRSRPQPRRWRCAPAPRHRRCGRGARRERDREDGEPASRRQPPAR